jgi:hypothetical protein
MMTPGTGTLPAAAGADGRGLEQAVARAHRMGQVRRVDVHRLLAEDSVDQRILEIVGRKRAEFDEYARRSDLKEVTPDSVDISDLAATKDVAAQVESERRIIELERERLRMEEEYKQARLRPACGRSSDDAAC